jgi:hypothetical protein
LNIANIGPVLFSVKAKIGSFEFFWHAPGGARSLNRMSTAKRRIRLTHYRRGVDIPNIQAIE